MKSAAAIALVFLALHLAFLPASLEDLDSINFALGLRQFDVAHHQPHPPGYPVYIAAGKLVNLAVPNEAAALSVIGAVAGGLGVFAFVALFATIDRTQSRRWAIAAAGLTVTCPLYWFTASRPLTDVPGLAAATAVQALTLTASSDRGLMAASLLAALAIGLRSQLAWLTVPLLAFVILRHRTSHRTNLIAGSAAAFLCGVLAWAVPLLILSGGPAAYWRALFGQGAEDFTGVQMLWTTRTIRQAVAVLYYAFVAPWATWSLAAAVLAFSAIGLGAMVRARRPPLVLLATAFGPYLLFDLVFQESVTSRYALPAIAPMAYLAVRGASLLPRNAGMMLAVTMIGLAGTLGAGSVAGYASMPAPAFRTIEDMRMATAGRPTAPALATHRREDLDMRRPFLWTGEKMPAFSQRLAAPPKHEWLELVKYWNSGGQEPVWFLADPMRTDVALVDRSSARHVTYRWPLAYPVLLSGVRPNELDWYIIDRPSWYLGAGWSLTPETAGVAEEDRKGPGLAPIEGWIRRRSEQTTLMIGGRNFQAEPATITPTIDGRPLEGFSVPTGFFLRFFLVPAGTLLGDGDHARLTIASNRPRSAIEQFDVQSAGRPVFGYGDGWHEAEYNPGTGRSWRWISERGVIRVHGGTRGMRLTMQGETERVTVPTRVTIRVAGRVVAQTEVGRQFAVQAEIPADLVNPDETAVVVESDRFFVPAERSWRSRDLRHLALRIYDLQLRPAS